MTSITEETDNALSHQLGQTALVLGIRGPSRSCAASPSDSRCAHATGKPNQKSLGRRPVPLPREPRAA